MKYLKGGLIRMKTRRLWHIVALTIALFLVTIHIPMINAQAQDTNNKLTVMVSMPDFIPIVKAIGGEKIEIKEIMPPGSDPHGFSLTQDILESLEEAELIVLANSELLHYEESVIENYPDKIYTDFIDYEDKGVSLSDFPDYEQSPHGYWFQIENGRAIAKAIADELSSIDKGNADYYSSNRAQFLREMDNLEDSILKYSKDADIYGAKVVASIPGVCYIIENMGLEVSSILLSEGSANVDSKKRAEVVDNIRNGEYIGIVVPESMKEAKAGEISRQILEDAGGASIIYVDFATASEEDTYPGLQYSNAMAFISSAKERVDYVDQERGNYYLGIIISLIILALIEGFIIYRNRKSEVEGDVKLYGERR